MKKLIMTAFVFLIPGIVSAARTSDEKTEQIKKEREIAVLKNMLEDLQDSLQYETTKRYTLKQQYVEQREIDKAEFDRFREQQEKVYNQYSQVKEEIFSREQLLTDERKETAQKADEWTIVKSTLADLLQKEAAVVPQGFPSRIESYLAELEAVRHDYGSDKNPAAAIGKFTKYKAGHISEGSIARIEHVTLIPQENGPVQMDLARFGNVFAYGVDSAGNAYLVHQAGQIGADRYAIDRINAAPLSLYVDKVMPEWVRAGKPSGTVMVDVMQNDQTRLLLSGKKTTWWQDTYESFKQGGWVMIPLLLLPFWVVYLVLYKFFQIYFRKQRIKNLFQRTMKAADKGNFEELSAYLSKQKGTIVRIVKTCVDYRGRRSRQECERVIREIILHEIPIINRGINTVAVIAGAAPLLGLLGTISGMIALFAAVTHYGTGDPKFLAGGISEALITAKTGLAIAIPSLFLHNWLRGSKEALLARIEEYVSLILTRFWPDD
jgi:biopolymer transport protein ExbB